MPKLIPIRGVPRSSELIIHAVIRVRQRIWFKQYFGRCVGQRSTVGILPLNVYLGEEVFLCSIVKLPYHKCSFTFPQLLIQIREKNWLFFFFRLTNLTGFGGFTKSDATDEF